MSAGRRDQPHRQAASQDPALRNDADLGTTMKGDRCWRRSSASPASHGNLLPWHQV